MRIAGEPAIVTGGASGLGAATARALAAAGAKVAILDLAIEAARAVAEEIGGVAICCDVAEAEAMGAALALARERHGVARIVASVAGIGPPRRILGRDGPMPLDVFAQVIRVNLLGSFNVLRLCAADMATLDPREHGERGVIIQTASIAAYEGQVGQAAYAASKGGVVAMTLPAARELAQLGIRVVTIAPGLFRTPLLESLPAEVQTHLAAGIPFPKRLGDPSEFADLALHIVANTALNGEVIRLDGALRMPPR